MGTPGPRLPGPRWYMLGSHYMSISAAYMAPRPPFQLQQCSPGAAPPRTQVVTQGHRLHSCSPPARGSCRPPLPASTCRSVSSGGRKPRALSAQLSARGFLFHRVGDEHSAGFEPSTCSVRSQHGQAPLRTPAPAHKHLPMQPALPTQKLPQSGGRPAPCPLSRLHALISFQVYLFAAISTSCDSLLIHKYLGSETQNIR